MVGMARDQHSAGGRGLQRSNITKEGTRTGALVLVMVSNMGWRFEPKPWLVSVPLFLYSKLFY